MSVHPRDESAPDTVTITESDGWCVVAADEDAGIASQDETKAEVLANLAEAFELHERLVPKAVDDEFESSTAPWF